VAEGLCDLAQERFIALLLDVRHRLLAVVTVAEGGLTACVVDPRVLFAAALVSGANAVLVAHNHPSGDPSPSAEDLDLTRQLVQAGAVLRLPVLDHVVVGGDDYRSIRELHPLLFEAGGREAII
jgi:DNA repair protein RadC